MGILRERFNRYKEIIFEGFKQSLELKARLKNILKYPKSPF